MNARECQHCDTFGISGQHAARCPARLPYGWQDWARFERHPTFVEWIDEPPTDPRASRYAIVRDGGIRWARVSPNPDVRPELSSGCFYDTGDPNDHPEGAREWCRRAARAHAKKIDLLVNASRP